MIEITQLLYQIVRDFNNIDTPYKNCKAIHSTLSPYRWISNSEGNFNWALKLAYSLSEELY